MPQPGRRSLIVIQHVAVEGLGAFEAQVAEGGRRATVIGPDAHLPGDVLDSAAGVIVMGGPMGVYEAERYPRLAGEIALLQKAVAAGTPVLGVCLGSQLLAAALGARVYPGPRKELGWFDVVLSSEAGSDPLFGAAPPRFKALHWHGDVFDLPPGARHLASSDLTKTQAFVFGRSAYGLLFHLEARAEHVDAMARAFPDETATAGTSTEELLAGAQAFDSATDAVGRVVFGAWLSLLGA